MEEDAPITQHRLPRQQGPADDPQDSSRRGASGTQHAAPLKIPATQRLLGDRNHAIACNHAAVAEVAARLAKERQRQEGQLDSGDVGSVAATPPPLRPVAARRCKGTRGRAGSSAHPGSSARTRSPPQCNAPTGHSQPTPSQPTEPPTTCQSRPYHHTSTITPAAVVAGCSMMTVPKSRYEEGAGSHACVQRCTD